jgi:Ni,Fe-hydrogenase III small subunit
MSNAINALTRSLNVFHLGGSACNNCDIEILDALTPKYDLERFGITLVGSIRHADVVLVAGIFNRKAALRAKEVLEQAPKPYLIIGIGGCPCTGMMWRESYNWERPAKDFMKIDAFVPGCPPKPEAIISAVVKVIGGLRSGDIVPACLQEDDGLTEEPAGAAL